MAAAEDVCQFLSTALVECDLDRQQLCHERLFEIAIERKAADVEIKHLNSIRKRNDQEFAEMQRVSEETGLPMPRKGKKHVTAVETMGASKLREACIDNKEVFTLGLLEQCELDALVPNNFLSQLLRIALSSSLGEINWGVQCTCQDHRAHDSGCWWVVAEVYFFLETEFFHIMIHQMWVEGAFNRLSMNQCNSSPELMGAKLHGSMNGTAGEMVDSTEINRKVRELQQAKLEQNRNVEKKTQEITNYFCSKPTKQRQVRTKEQKEQDEKEERERLAIAVEERARKLREKEEKAAERAAITVANRAKKLKEKEERASAAAMARARKLKHKEDATAAAAARKEEQIAAATSSKRQKKSKPKEKRKHPQPTSAPTIIVAETVDRSGTKRCTECNTWLPVSELDHQGKCVDQDVGSTCFGRRKEGLGKRLRVAKTF